jgi:hypothetical protein
VKRIRVGDHRIGLFIEGNLAEFVRVHSRRDVYREFSCAQLFELRGAGEVQITGVFPRLPAGQADG